MRPIARVLLAFTALIAVSIAAAAPPAGRVARIGYLVLAPLTDTPSAERAAFFDGMRELGYVEGENLLVEYRSAEGRLDLLPLRAKELLDLDVEVIVAAGSAPVLAASEATRTVPIVMMWAPDPVAMGLARSLARPGGNVTGEAQMAEALGAKRVQLLKEALPSISTIAVIRDSSNTWTESEYQGTLASARALGVDLLPLDAKGSPSLSGAFAEIVTKRPDALITIIDLRTAGYAAIIPEFALEQRLPSMSGLRAFTVHGGLMSYAEHFPALARRSATYVDKILNGADPAELPIEQPRTFRLVVNLETARTLGLTIAPSVLLRADELIR